MTVSVNYQAFILEQLTRALGQARARRLFRGLGVYCGALCFALMDNDTLYFKVDEDTIGDFERRGMGPFRPFGDGGASMRYYEVPADVIEDDEALRGWAGRALTVARRAQRRKPRIGQRGG